MRPKLTAERVRELLSYNKETGIFTWRVSRPGPARAGDVAGRLAKHYWYIGVDGKYLIAHRLAWLYEYGVWPSGEIDHIDRNKLNNRIANLRDVNRATNVQNQPAKGFYFQRGLFVACVVANGKRYDLGAYKTEAEASAAYLSGKRILHKDCPTNGGNAAEADYSVMPRSDGLARNNTSGHAGVSFKAKQKKYEAHIRANGKYKYVGLFDCIDDAVKARHIALTELGKVDPQCADRKHKETP